MARNGRLPRPPDLPTPLCKAGARHSHSPAYRVSKPASLSRQRSPDPELRLIELRSLDDQIASSRRAEHMSREAFSTSASAPTLRRSKPSGFHASTSAPRQQLTASGRTKNGQYIASRKRPMSLDRQSILYSEAPSSTMDLGAYHKQLFPDGTGKINDNRVNPSRYGSVLEKDLGLCQATFLEHTAVCPDGMHCPWRHQALNGEERLWIKKWKGGKGFLAQVDAKYALPCMPVISSFSAAAGTIFHSRGC